MPINLINNFILEHKNPDKIVERISMFETIRDFIYQINWVSTPEKLLEVKKWYCTSKHRLLKEIYDRLWYQTKLCFIPFSFDMIYLPVDLKNRWYANKKWYHTFLQMLIDDKWINIDATFNPELKDFYIVNENRDWISSQKVVCNYDKIYIPNSLAEEHEIKKLLLDNDEMAAEDYERIEKFNSWIKSFNKESQE